jgi:plastocyanin
MRIRGHARGPRGLLLLLTGLLGAAAVVLPAVASSEMGPWIKAVDEGGVYEYHRWEPPTATVNAGGVVSFSNPSEAVKHGVEWKSPPATPTCSGVPVGPAVSGTGWSGTCTFSQPGKYEFWCTVHGEKMRGTVTVNAGGTTTTTTYPPPTTTGSTTAPAYPSSGPEGSPPSSASSPLAGSASTAVKLPSSEHGSSVRGSVAISQAGAGGSLEVDLLAKSASLASAGHATRVRVGRLVLSRLRAGKATFSVALNRQARGALRRHRQLALSARIVVQPMTGLAATVTRSVVLHA